MPRLLRALAPLALAAAVAAPSGVQATDTLTFAFAVNCDGSTATMPAGLTMPTGTYVVSVSGGCIYNYGTHSQPVDTPCTAPVVGPVPCVGGGTTIDNIPDFYGVSTGSAQADLAPSVRPFGTGCVSLYLQLDGAFCVAAQATTYVRNIQGAMTARFVDSNYGDNRGAFLVTVTWV